MRRAQRATSEVSRKQQVVEPENRDCTRDADAPNLATAHKIGASPIRNS
jgi:hypothetical protein